MKMIVENGVININGAVITDKNGDFINIWGI